MHALAAIIECERFIDGGARHGDALCGLCKLSTLAVNLVTGHARHGGLIGEMRAGDAPRALRVLRLDEITDRAIEVHSVAAQAVVHEAALGVVDGVCKDLLIRSAVGADVPARVLLLVTALAVRRHGEHIDVAQADGLRNGAEDVHADMAQLGLEAGFMALHAADGAML